MINITLRQLEIFCMVYEKGSVSSAAQKLNLVQSATSNALKQLENQLNQTLFDRISKRLIVNDAGKVFYPKARNLLDEANITAHYFDDYIPPLKIAASSTIGNYLIPQVIEKHRQQFPQQKIDLFVGNTQDIIAKTASFECDVGFIEGECSQQDLDCHFWCYDHLTFFAKKNSRWLDNRQEISIKALNQLPVIYREKGSGTREYLESVIQQNIVQYELSSSEAIKTAVKEDIGISCLSQAVISDTDSFEKLKIIDLPELKRSLYWLTHKEKGKSQATQNFLYQAIVNSL